MKNETLYLIDLDRTLINTDKIVKMLAISLNSQGYDGDALVTMIEKARISEQDINTKDAIDSLGKGAWESVEEYFHDERNNQGLVFEDARIFLEKLKSAGLPHIILTFGISKDWQHLKITSTGLDYVPTIVTESRDKSRTINSWMNSSGVYALPGFTTMSARNIVLIDDRPNAFLHAAGNFRGYLVDRQKLLPPSFKTPPKTEVINNLTDIKF